MNRLSKFLITLLALSSILLIPVNAQIKEVGIYGVWTDKNQYNPGETVILTIELTWDLPASYDVSPGVYDTTLEEYVVEELLTVEGSGVSNVTLSFTAPPTNGVYEYIVDVFYEEDGWQSSSTGSEEYYLYVQVGSTGSNAYNAWVTDVDSPSSVNPGELFTVTVDVDISFPTMTTFAVGITNRETDELVIDYEDQGEGDLSGTYTFDIYAPETERKYTLGADIVFETPQGWTFTDGGSQTFDVKVSKGGGIPGFPVAGVALGSLITMALLSRRREH